MNEEEIRRRFAPVPRYTSYPTAPHFHAGVDSHVYASWLETLANNATISLYIHIPFCDRLCWFCGCQTKQVQRYDPVKTYLEALHQEIDIVSRHLNGKGMVTAVHLGGGSPTMLSSEDMLELRVHLDRAFHLVPEVEISVEIDPNDMVEDRYIGLQRLGLTRASLGVQDFAEKVQKAINRPQGYEETKAVVDRVRQIGVGSVNLDMLYGLPFQTCDSIAATTRQVLSMRPDRIALFGYAHVPWMKKHQSMIDESQLPDAQERLRQSQLAAAILAGAGYIQIGIDHFALPTDSLALAQKNGKLRRNFQGYTDDCADALIGLGASSIGQFPQGHVQNMPATGEYQRLVKNGELAVVRGKELTDEDRLRGYVIEQIMCSFGFSRVDMNSKFGAASSCIFQEAEALVAQGEYLMRNNDRFEIKYEMRPFARQVAARFDSYLRSGEIRHSLAV